MAGRNGRPRTPIALRRLHGNPTGQPLPAAPAEGVGSLWRPPEWMDEEQRAQWHYAVEHAPAGLLTATDRETLAIWCVACVEYVQAVREVRRVGQIVRSKSDIPYQNPSLGIANRQALLMLKVGGELGFSPSARASLGSRGANGSTAGSPQLAQYLDGADD